MRLKVQALLVLAVLLATLWLSGCGQNGCDHTGAASCSGTGSNTGGGGTTGGAGGGGGNGGGGGGGGGGNGNGGGSPTVYAFSGLAGGTGISTFTFSAGGKDIFPTPNITPATAPSSGGGRLIVVHGQYVYATFYGTGLFSQIYGWTIGSNGALTAIAGSPFTVAGWTGAILGGFATNNTGTLLFMTDPGAFLGESNVHVFSVGTGGVLTEASGSPVSIPFAPGGMTMDALGKYLYIIGITGTGAGYEIGAYSVSGSSLTVVPGSPFFFPMTQVAGDASGKYLIGTTSSLADNHLYVFSIEQSGANAGAIAQVAGSPFATKYSPYEVVAQPIGGELVYSFSLSSTGGNPVEGYQLNTSSGALTALSGSPFPAAVADLGFFDQGGGYLFGLNQLTLTAYAVSSSGGLTSVGTLSEGYGSIAVADVP